MDGRKMPDGESPGAKNKGEMKAVSHEGVPRSESGLEFSRRVQTGTSYGGKLLRAKKWCLAVLTACILGMIIIVLIAFILQWEGYI